MDVKTQLKTSQAVIQIAKDLHKTTGLDNAVENMMSYFVDLVDADEGAIQLLRPTSITTRCTLVRQEDENNGLLDKRFDDLLTGTVLRQTAGLKTDDIASLLFYRRPLPLAVV